LQETTLALLCYVPILAALYVVAPWETPEKTLVNSLTKVLKNPLSTSTNATPHKKHIKLGQKTFLESVVDIVSM
jgi:hypothetical protein